MNMAQKAYEILFILLLICGFSVHSSGQCNPKANPDAIVTSGKMRFTVLTPEMVRMEWSNTKEFEDRASFIAVNRNFPVPEYTSESKGGYLYIRTEKLTLRYKEGTHPLTNPASSDNLSITFNLNGMSTQWYPRKKDALNLKGTTRTLDHSKGDNMRNVMEDGIISRSGWVLIDENKPNGDTGKSLLFENQGGEFDWVEQRKNESFIDWYFMCYGHDYKRALADYTKLGGNIPMPPLYSFGYWYSKYERYTEKDFKDIVNEIQEHDIPIDIMVVDMDWHYANHPEDGGRGGWTGWSWNKDLFPNPAEFITWLHDRNLKTTLNLHPADGMRPDEDIYEAMVKDLNISEGQDVKWNIESQDFYAAFAKNFLHPQEQMGVDFWWLDWQQWPLAPNEKNLSNTFWLNHVFYNDMRVNRPNRRPMIFHRWGGLGNHRYQIGFSGDSWATFPTLAFQVYYNSTASNVAYGYWSHDLGGHNQAGPNNPELYLRWIQFGIFSPMVRSHATNAPHIERRIWKYPNFELMRDAIKLRYRMIPYIYTYARQSYDTGVSICRPLYYDYPEVDEAYKAETTYMFGDEILVSPIVAASNFKIGTATKQFWLPEGKWYEAETGDVLEGNQKHERSFAQNEIPFYYKEGAIIPQYPDIKHLKEKVNSLIVEFVPGKSGSFSYYEDAGDNDEYKIGKFTTTKITQETSRDTGVYVIYPREGAFEGMILKRSYKFRILSKLPADKISVNGNEYTYSKEAKAGYWTYDAESLAIVIDIPITSCNERITVDVAYSKEQNSLNNLIIAKKGQFRRLSQFVDSMKVKYPKEFIELVETSKRITLNPRTIEKELRSFDKNLKVAFSKLAKEEGAFANEINEWRDFIINGVNKHKITEGVATTKNETPGKNLDETQLWITGTAVPNNTAVLVEDPNLEHGYFRYNGKLQSGEFRIMNTPTVQSDTKYYVPTLENENAVGTCAIALTDDVTAVGWEVTVADDYYKIKINTIDQKVEGQLFAAREDLFIIGGATEAGWKVANAIRLRKDTNNPNLFIFEGELKIGNTPEHQDQFKLLGQDDWAPVSFHPRNEMEPLLGSKYICENLRGDNKWAIDPEKQGRYIIKVDLLQETIEAEYLGK